MGDCQRNSGALDVCIDPIPTFPCSQGKECLCDDCASPAIASNFNKPLVLARLFSHFRLTHRTEWRFTGFGNHETELLRSQEVALNFSPLPPKFVIPTSVKGRGNDGKLLLR